MTKLAQTAVKLHLKALRDEGLVTIEKSGLYPSFRAAKENPQFKLLKAQNIVLRLHQSRTVEAIEKACYPSCIVLFGSASRGEDSENSDIDIFVQAKHKAIDLSKFEDGLKRKIHIVSEPRIKALSQELLNNIINGIVLSGYLKVI